jgi:hypothetical protein
MRPPRLAELTPADIDGFLAAQESKADRSVKFSDSISSRLSVRAVRDQDAITRYDNAPMSRTYDPLPSSGSSHKPAAKHHVDATQNRIEACASQPADALIERIAIKGHDLADVCHRVLGQAGLLG